MNSIGLFELGISLAMLLFGCICSPACSQGIPSINLTYTENESGINIDTAIADQDGDLVSATLYVLDEQTLDVLWAEHRILQGDTANLSFFWTHRGWRASNGIETVQPVLAVNTIDMPPEEAPYLVYSAPCLLELTPGAQMITALAYFDNDGVFHSLTDLAGNSYYKSIELLAATGPRISYGSYIKNNITLVVGASALSFFRLNLNEGLSPLQPLVLDRSPIHHYTLRLESIDLESVPYILEVEADDSTGNRVREFSKNPGQF